MGERPTAAVARDATITTISVAAKKTSGLLVRAAWANRGGRRYRPASISTTMTRAPAPNVCRKPPESNSASPRPMAPSRKMMGTIAMSSNSRVPSAARPTGVRRFAILSTKAVDDSARARPKASPVATELPSMTSPTPIRAALPNSSSGPRRKIVSRRAANRLNDSSSPIPNSSSTMPNSAKGSSASRLLMVT